MKLVVTDTYEQLSDKAAALILAQVQNKPRSLFVLPTGATPLGLFRRLVEAGKAGHADFSAAIFAVLDEYAGIATSDRRSLCGWLRRELLDPLAISDDRILTFTPHGEPQVEAERMEHALAQNGGIDVAVLGLGPNGHLGFNEPGSAFDSGCRLVSLTPESIRSNAAYWGSEADVPRTGFTLGLGTLLAARDFVLMVSGAHKADILARTINGPASVDLPATIVHLHPNAIVLADRAARPSKAQL